MNGTVSLCQSTRISRRATVFLILSLIHISAQIHLFLISFLFRQKTSSQVDEHRFSQLKPQKCSNSLILNMFPYFV